jgi:hypothetical protein
VAVVPTAPEYATPAAVMARLHLKPDHPDADYVALCTDAANDLVDTWLDRTDTESEDWPPLVAPYPSAVVRGAIGAAIRTYRFRDTESNLDDAWGPEGVAVSLPRDPLAGYVDMMTRYRNPRAWAPT